MGKNTTWYDSHRVGVYDVVVDDQPRQRDTGRRVVTWIVVAVIVVVLVLIGAQVIPRWWSHRVANVVDGSLTTGALFGLFIGFVFTVVPLILLALVIRYRREGRSWKGWIGWLLLVLITAAPNLMTLGIVLGRSSAAHAAERTLDVDAPGFRTWSLVGAIGGVRGGGRAGVPRAHAGLVPRPEPPDAQRAGRASADTVAEPIAVTAPDAAATRRSATVSVTPMGRWLTERRLSQVAARLKALRSELAIIDEQLVQFSDDADELSLRALMSETPLASHESNEARKHVAAMRKHRAHVVAEITELEHNQDRLLDQLTG